MDLIEYTTNPANSAVDGTARTAAAAAQTTANAAAPSLLAFNDQVGTTYTVQASDLGKEIRCANVGAIALTIPSNATLALPIGFNFRVRQNGVGQVTGAVTTDTLNPTSGFLAKTRVQNSVISFVKQTATTWTFEGDAAFV